MVCTAIRPTEHTHRKHTLQYATIPFSFFILKEKSDYNEIPLHVYWNSTDSVKTANFGKGVVVV